MEESSGSARSESDWSWTKGSRPSRALVLEAVRIVIAVFLVISVVFGAIEVWPGSPSLSLTPHNPQYLNYTEQNRATFALDQPLLVRYGVFVADVFTGQMGMSYLFQRPVTDIVAEAVPVTWELVLGSLLWTVLLGAVLGWAAASPRFRRLRRIPAYAATVLYGVPIFFLVLLILEWAPAGFFFALPGFPPYAGVRRVTGFITLDTLLTGDWGLFARALGSTALLTLPVGLAFCLPAVHRVRRALETRRRSAEFASLPDRRGLPAKAAVRASLAPLAGAVGILLPFVYGASLITEILASRRGAGWTTVLALDTLDAPLLMGALVLPTLLLLAVSAPFTLLGAWLLREDARSADPALAGGDLRSLLSGALGRLRKWSSLPFWAGIVILAVPLALSLAAPWVAPAGPFARAAPTSGGCTPGMDCPLSPPSPAHPLGVDILDRDIFNQVLWGGWYLIGWLGVAVGTAAGLGLVFAFFVAPLGRAGDLPVRALLGAVAAIPVLLLVYLLATGFVLTLALAVVFVPVFYRDARDPALRALRASPSPLPHIASVRGWPERAETAIRASLTTVLVKLPRRVAEAALLAESVTFLFGTAPAGTVDWASVMVHAFQEGALQRGNPWALYLPGVLILLLAAGLLLLSEGLRELFRAQPSAAETAPPSAAPGVSAAGSDANP